MARDLSSLNPDRRSKPRVRCSYPAIVRVHPANKDSSFVAPAVLSDMSAAGMYMRMRREVQVGDKVFIVVRFSTAPLQMAEGMQKTTPQIAALGRVTRVELQPDGSHGIAVRLSRHRFL